MWSPNPRKPQRTRPTARLGKIVRKTLDLYTRAVHGRNSQLSASAIPSSHEPLDAAPIFPDWVEEGSPQASTRVLSSSGDGGMVTGIWHCTAGTFRWVFACDEVIHVLEGGVEVEHEGRTLTLEPAARPLAAREFAGLAVMTRSKLPVCLG